MIHLYGGNNVSRTLEETLAGQMDHPSFPVHLTDMGAKMHFHGIDGRTPVEVDAGDGTKALISAAPGNHPNGVWAYRVDHAGASVVYATDTEHYAVVDPKLTKLATGADVLIYDLAIFAGGVHGRGWRYAQARLGPQHLRGGGEARDRGRREAVILYHHDPTQKRRRGGGEGAAREHFCELRSRARSGGLVIELLPEQTAKVLRAVRAIRTAFRIGLREDVKSP